MKKRILCFGDSNTWGYIPGTAERYDEDTRWTSLLGKKLGDGFAVIEEGMTGRTTAFDTGFDDYLNGKKALGYILKSQLPLDAVVVMLGTNDICDHRMDRIELALTEIVRQIKNANRIFRTKTPVFPSDNPVVLLVSPLPFGDACPLRAEIKKESMLYPSMTKRVAVSMGVHFLDPGPYIKPSDTDGIHLSAESHALLASLVYNSLMEILL